MEQLLCHLFADYWLQNDWMALNKKKHFWIALVHSIIYTIPFLLLTCSWLALSVICITHAIIDHTDIGCRLNQRTLDYRYRMMQECNHTKLPKNKDSRLFLG